MGAFDPVRSTVVMLAMALVGGCTLDARERLGELIFDDESLSIAENQSCATCHGSEVGRTGPDAALNVHGAVYEGSVVGRFGNRKPPTTAYATRAPLFDHDAEQFLGGAFWDGRATGWRLGSAAADQAQGPPLNPLEQALSSGADMVARVCAADYGPTFRGVFGADACADPDQGFAAIASAIAAFEGSRVESPFSAKFDAVLAGRATFTAVEQQGFDLFTGRAECVECHAIDTADGPAVFTDFTYEDLGHPKNPENPFYGMDRVLVDGEPINPLGAAWVDPGLGGFLETLARDDAWRAQPYVTPALEGMSPETLAAFAVENRGKHKVPTLRNVDRRPTPDFVKAYGHNGYFKSLKAVVHFYNTRDVLPRCDGLLTASDAMAAGCWPTPEVEENMNRDELGDLRLTDAEEDTIVAFLGTLSDGWEP